MTESAAAHEKSKNPRWIDWANRTTAVLAVLAALSSGRWGASNLQAILEQGKVNDTWSYYQADSIKAHGAGQMRDLARALEKGEPDERTKSLESIANSLDKEAAAKTEDKIRRGEDAQRFEFSRDRLVRRGFWFEISFASLQLGVILCTIATAARRKTIWLVSVVIGVLGILVFVNGIMQKFKGPAWMYQSVGEEMAYHADKEKK